MVKNKCVPYFVVVRFIKDGKYKIWKDYSENHVWGSPIYEVLAYFNTHKEARNFVKNNG